MKIVKSNKVVKFPHAHGSVKSVARNALLKANEQSWNKIIIIGESKDQGSWYSTSISDAELVGILEKVKNQILNG